MKTEKWILRERVNQPTAGVLYGISESDWGLVVWVPQPPFAFGKVGVMVCTADTEPDEAKQRANLIAAAPDLYAALEDMLCPIAISLARARLAPGRRRYNRSRLVNDRSTFGKDAPTADIRGTAANGNSDRVVGFARSRRVRRRFPHDRVVEHCAQVCGVQ